MAESDREPEIPRGLAAALLVLCGLMVVGALAYLMLLRRSDEPTQALIPGRTDPPIQQQLNIDALVQQKRSVIPPPDPRRLAPDAGSPDGQKQLVPEERYRSREPRIRKLLDELPLLLPDKFEARTHRSAGGPAMPYRLFRPPGYLPTRMYPLVVYLHGSSSRGTDNLKNIQHSAALGAGIWTLAENQLEDPCFILVPQCPDEPARWVNNGDWNAPSHEHAPEPTEPLRLAVEILDAVEKEFRIDSRRVYLAGTSMGGFGVFDLAIRHPKRFAAIVPVCGGMAKDQGRTIGHVPVWIFHGNRDETVPVKRSRDAFEAIGKHNRGARYTEYDRAGHDAWKYAFTEPGLAKWLFAQRLP